MRNSGGWLHLWISQRLRLGTIVVLVALAGRAGCGCGVALAASPTSQYISIPMTQADGTTVKLQALEIIPSGGGRFPLAVVSHGSPRLASSRSSMTPGGYQIVGQWLEAQGYAVVLPMRRGYGQSEGTWSEDYGACKTPDYVRAGLGSAADIEAVVSYMRRQSFVDPDRVVLVGHSAGAWGSIAAGSRNPPGVVAVVAFAPGRGSMSPDEVCGGSALVTAARQFGTTTHIPTLWIASENDHFFGPALARSMFDAFHAGTRANVTFVAAPSCSQDGHQLVLRCPDAWHDTVATFLRQVVDRK